MGPCGPGLAFTVRAQITLQQHHDAGGAGGRKAQRVRVDDSQQLGAVGVQAGLNVEQRDVDDRDCEQKHEGAPRPVRRGRSRLRSAAGRSCVSGCDVRLCQGAFGSQSRKAHELPLADADVVACCRPAASSGRGLVRVCRGRQFGDKPYPFTAVGEAV